MKLSKKMLIFCVTLVALVQLKAEEFCAMDECAQVASKEDVTTRAPREAEGNGIVGPLGSCAGQVLSSVTNIYSGGGSTGNVSATDAFTVNNRLVTVDLPGGARFIKESAGAVLDGSNNLSGINTITVAAGTTAAPSIQFAGSTNTGITAAAANELSLSTNGVEALHIDANGNTTYSSDYKVQAYLSTAGTITAATDTIVFNTITFDPSNSYDATTGIFTAPVTGTYLSSVSITTNGNGTATTGSATLVLNGSAVAGTSLTQNVLASINETTSSSVLITLAAGDELRVDYTTPGTVNLATGDTHWAIEFVSF